MNIKKGGCNKIELKPKSTQNSEGNTPSLTLWYCTGKETIFE